MVSEKQVTVLISIDIFDCGPEGELEDSGEEAGGIGPTETMLHRVSGLYTYL